MDSYFHKQSSPGRSNWFNRKIKTSPGAVRLLRFASSINLEVADGHNTIDLCYHNDGQLTVNVNGRYYSFSADEASMLTLDTGRGVNTIQITEE